MAEFTGIALQTVDAGQNVVLTETPVCGSNCIQHREGSGIVKLRGLTNNCKARFLVSFSGNIQIPTGGTVEAISVAIAVDGERAPGNICTARATIPVCPVMIPIWTNTVAERWSIPTAGMMERRTECLTLWKISCPACMA